MENAKGECEDTVCRICRSHEGGQIPIFGTSGAERTIPDKIHECLPVKVSLKDGLPQTLCESCNVQLEEFSRFRELARQSECHLAGLFSSDSDNSHSKQYKDKELNHVRGHLAEPRPEDYVLMKEETINVDNTSKTSNIMADYLVEFNNNRKLPSETEIADRDILSAMRRRREVLPPMWDVFERVHTDQERQNLQLVDGKQKGTKQALRSVLKGKFAVIHRRYIIAKGAFPCSLCGRCFKFNQGHPREEVDESDSENSEGLHGCSQCNLVFHTSEELNSHKSSHAEPTSLCPICGKGFSRNEHMVRHMSSVHGSPLPRPYNCDICQKVFGRKEHLQRHRLTHGSDTPEVIEEKPFTCDVCGIAYIRKEQLVKHKKFVHNVEDTEGESKPYVCDQCTKTFTRKEHLIRHKKIHLRDIPATVNTPTPIVKQVGKDTITLEISAGGGGSLVTHVANPDISTILEHGRYGNVSIKPATASTPPVPDLHPYYPPENLTEEQRAQLEGFLDSSIRCEQDVLPYEEDRQDTPPSDHALGEKESIDLEDLKRMPKCRICAKAFTKKNHLNRHLKRYHNLTKDQVNSGKFEMYENGEARVLDVGDEQEEENGEEDPAGGPAAKRPKCIFTCSVCRKTFTRKYHMYRHQKTQHGIEFPTRDQQKEEVRCNDCGMIFLKAEEMVGHECVENIDELEPARRKTAPVGSFKCAICKGSFETHEGFKGHECKKSQKLQPGVPIIAPPVVVPVPVRLNFPPSLPTVSV